MQIERKFLAEKLFAKKEEIGIFCRRMFAERWLEEESL
jgi:hypothetical protein